MISVIRHILIMDVSLSIDGFCAQYSFLAACVWHIAIPKACVK